MRSLNTKKYAHYFLFLEKIIKNYDNYQKLYMEEQLKFKDTKIDNLS
jgi:hypothetical protein